MDHHPEKFSQPHHPRFLNQEEIELINSKVEPAEEMLGRATNYIYALMIIAIIYLMAWFVLA